MSDAVAKLRFDLLANLAGFSGPMDEASSKAEKSAQRFNAAFDSTKNAAARAKQEVEAWSSAIADTRMEMARAGNGKGYMQMFDVAGGTKDVALRHETRIKELLPFGKTFRTELSKEAAETAAAIQKTKDGLGRELAGVGKELAGKAAEGAGLGGVFQSAMGFVGANPIATGAALIGGAAIEHVRERNAYVRETSRSATRLGESTENVSAMRAAGLDDAALSHLQRSIAEGGNAGLQALKLDPAKLAGESLKDAVTQVAEKLSSIQPAVEKARIAQELFGREGAEMIPVLANFKNKLAEVAEFQIVKAKEAAAVKASDREMSTAGKVWAGGEESLLGKAGLSGGMTKNFGRSLTMLGDLFFSSDKTMEKHRQQWNRDDEDILMADIRAKSRERLEKEQALAAIEAEGVKAIADVSQRAKQNVEDALADLANPGSSARRHFQDELVKAGANKEPGGVARAMDAYDAQQRALEFAREHKKDKEEGQALAEAARNPFQRFKDSMSNLKDLFGKGDLGPGAYRAAASNYGKEYLSAMGVHGASAGAVESYNAQVTAIERMRRAGWDERAANRLLATAHDQELSALGVSRPMDNFQKKFQELASALKAGDITQAEFDRSRRKLREAAIGEATSDIHTVSPVAAMAAGSREAYSMMVRTQLNDPKEQLAKQTVSKLDQIEKNTRPGQAQQANTLDF